MLQNRLWRVRSGIVDLAAWLSRLTWNIHDERLMQGRCFRRSLLMNNLESIGSAPVDCHGLEQCSDVRSIVPGCDLEGGLACAVRAAGIRVVI